jgi:hypothetical protein
VASEAHLFIHFGIPVAPTGDSPVMTEVIDAGLNRVWQGVITLAGGGKQVDVARGGDYLVRAWLPNGELVTTQVEAAAGRVTDVSLLPSVRSPHENWAWAFYVQPTVQPRQAALFREPIFEVSRLSELRIDAVTGPSFTENADATVIVENSFGNFEPADTISIDKGPIRLQVKTRAQQTWLRLREANVSLLESPSEFLVAMPTIDLNTVEVLVSPDPMRGLRINVFTNPTANAILGYITQADHANARALGEPLALEAERLLRRKRDDAVLAAIGGYALVCSGDMEKLHDWSFNLANWFPQLPDGAVIAAWHVLQTSAEFDEVEKYFHLALDRGVPLMSIGLRLLFELGEIIASSPHGAELERNAIRRLRNLEAARQHWTPTTVLRLTSPPDAMVLSIEESQELIQ